MKINYYLLLLFMSSILKSQSYYQYFEGQNNSLPVTIVSSTTNIWQIGKPQKTLFSSASTTPNVIVTDTVNYYPNKNVSRFTFTLVLFPGFPSPVALQWKQKLNMDSKKDGGIIEFSTNSGLTWKNAHNNPNIYQFYGFQPANKDTINGNEYCFSGTDSTWRDIWLCLPNAVWSINDSVQFRFTFKSDSINTNKEGWMIDNLGVHQTFLHPVKELSQIDNIVVYPNVTNGIINVEIKKKSSTDMIESIVLVNSDGKLIENYGQNYTKVLLDISKYQAGLYYLIVTVNKKVSKFKILYEKN